MKGLGLHRTNVRNIVGILWLQYISVPLLQKINTNLALNGEFSYVHRKSYILV